MLSLCSSCISVSGLQPKVYSVADEPHKCVLCYGILSNVEFRQRLTKDIAASFKDSGYDGSKMIIAVNVPVSILLREFILTELYGDGWKSKEQRVKSLFANLIQNDIERVGFMDTFEI